jgi:putative ABC transport system permease protein
MAFKALSERRLRAALTIVGIAIGPTALVAITSVVKGYSDYIIDRIQGLGQNLVVVFPSANYQLTERDLNYFRSLDGVYRAEPFYAVTGYVKRGTEKVKVQVYCVDLTVLMDALKGLKIAEGGIPPPYAHSRAVVGYYIAFDENGRNYYRVGDVVGVEIPIVEPGGRLKVRRVNVAVSGILAEFGNAFVVNPDTTVFLPLEAGRRLLGLTSWSGVLIVASDPVYVENITRHLRRVYADRVTVVSLIEISRVVASITAAMNFVTYATGLAAFAVAAAGVAATMITSVIERTREIGVLKAVGFTSADVVAMIVLEAVIMSLLGATAGIALGVLGAHILASHGMVIRGAHTFVIRAPPAITPELIASTLALTIAVGVLGSSIAAYQAARIPPAVALRYE